MSLQATDLAGKRFELLREVVPGLRRLAIIADVDVTDAMLEVTEVQATARGLGLEVVQLSRPARGPGLKNLSRPKVEWGPIWSSAH